MIALKVKFSVPLHQGEGADRGENGDISGDYELQVRGDAFTDRDKKECAYSIIEGKLRNMFKNILDTPIQPEYIERLEP